MNPRSTSTERPTNRGDRTAEPGGVRDVPRRRVRLIHDFRVAVTGLAPREWLAHVAQAPSATHQQATITTACVSTRDQTLRLQPGRELSPLARPILSIVVPADQLSDPRRLCVRTVYEATLCPHELVPGTPENAPPPLDPRESKWYTAATSSIDHDSPAMRSWIGNADLARQPDEAAVAFAARTLAHFKKHLRWIDVRDFDPGHKASLVCAAGRGDCAKLSIAYVAVLRANQVPARVIGARQVPSGHAHILTEFHTPTIGWIPVDVLVDREDEIRHRTEGNTDGFGAPGNDCFIHYEGDGFRLPTFTGLREILGMHSVAWDVDGAKTRSDHTVDERWAVQDVT